MADGRNEELRTTEGGEVRHRPEILDGVVESTVSVGKIPGAIGDVAMHPGMTVAQAFAAAGVHDLTGCELQRNGVACGMNTPVQPGDTVLAVTKVCGNRR